jgi:hypothetical protein
LKIALEALPRINQAKAFSKEDGTLRISQAKTTFPAPSKSAFCEVIDFAVKVNFQL